MPARREARFVREQADDIRIQHAFHDARLRIDALDFSQQMREMPVALFVQRLE